MSRSTRLIFTSKLRLHIPTPRHLSAAVDPSVLLRVCTSLHHQQHSSDDRLHSSLRKSLASDTSPNPHLTPEFFLRVCNSFPLSWRPVYRFYLFTLAAAPNSFTHSSLTLNKLLGVVGNDRNIYLFWEILEGMARDRLLDRKTFLVATRTFAEVRELKKCVQVFHLANRNGWEYSLDTLNMVAEDLCRRKLVKEAQYLVAKLKKEVPELRPDAVTYGWLVKGYCETGDLVEASKHWNLMVDEGLEPDIWVCEVMMETLFKTNRFSDAMGILHMMKLKMMDRLGISNFRVVMRWLGKVGNVRGAYMVFVEMLKRGIEDDDSAMSSLIYGLLARGRVREARKVFDGMKCNPEIGVYHGIIMGLLKLRRPSEASGIFREMIRRGCEPTMHTYIMLLQGHLGKRGRKGTDAFVNFDTIFVGGLVKAGKFLEVTKYVERTMDRSLEVPRFDYNKFLHYYSNDEGVAFFEEASKKLREAGMVDLADILARYGERMATRDRRRDRPRGRCEDRHEATTA